MDVHPTPFPGKRRPAANSIATKDGERIKSSKKPTSQTLLATAPTRPKRAFGVARSANILVEKSLSKPATTKACKPWKPSGNATKPAKADAPAMAVTGKDRKANENAVGGDSSKTKSSSKKHQHVSFQDPVEAGAVDGDDKIAREEGICTPMSANKSAALGTPYHSARDCSKCRLDKMETSTYWLAQIKLAETVGRHFVAAAFFRLALECQAQPFHKLLMELKHYAARHRISSAESLWSDLFKAYGLSTDDEPNAYSCNIDKFDSPFAEQEEPKPDAGEVSTICETNKGGCLEYDVDDNPIVNETEEAPVHDVHGNTTDLKDVAVKEESTEAKPALDTCEDPHPENKNSEAMIISHMCANESLEENALGNRSPGEKSNRGTRLCMKSSSWNTRAQRSGGSADKGRSSAKKNQAGSKFSVREQMRTNVNGGKRDGSDQLRSKDKEDLKGDNFNSDVFGEDATTNQST